MPPHAFQPPEPVAMIHEYALAQLAHVATTVGSLPPAPPPPPPPSVSAPPKLPKCSVNNCEEPACGSRSGFCAAHAYGPRRCEFPGCAKCAQQGADRVRRFCTAHGGGRRCTHPGCAKGARDRFFCAAHGGGKRCKEAGCTKGAVGASDRCTAHGGGRRCQSPGCRKSAQSSTDFCIRHGGGRTCRVVDCVRAARGRSLFCATHRSALPCPFPGCNTYSGNYDGVCDAHRPTRRFLPITSEKPLLPTTTKEMPVPELFLDLFALPTSPNLLHFVGPMLYREGVALGAHASQE